MCSGPSEFIILKASIEVFIVCKGSESMIEEQGDRVHASGTTDIQREWVMGMGSLSPEVRVNVETFYQI